MAVWQATTSVIDNWRKQAFTFTPLSQINESNSDATSTGIWFTRID
jgi:hypothetical protein